MSKHTNGEWEWYYRPGQGPYLATRNNGRLLVMEFKRKGMASAKPVFATWTGERTRDNSGIMGAEAIGPDGLHPDARLIAAAPDMYEALQLALPLLVRCNEITLGRTRDNGAISYAMQRVGEALKKAGGE